MFKKLTGLIKQYPQAWIFSYVFIYFPGFFYLEHTITEYTLIHTTLDDKIPFCEYFIVPYLLWFAYIVVTLLYFLFQEDKLKFYQLTGHLFTGMTIFLLICLVFPNGTDLRPQINPDKNIFTKAISLIYIADTSTNIFPSMHVFVSIGVHTGIKRSRIGQNLWIRFASFCLMVSIILSTVFLKQHSVIDILGGILLAMLMYVVFYLWFPNWWIQKKRIL